MQGTALATHEIWNEIRELNRKMSEAVKLLEEIAEAFRPPEPPEEISIEDACRCMKLNGSPISNCPICKGTGLP